MISVLFRNFIILIIICIFISPIFIMKYLSDIGINNQIIAILILLFIVIVLNTIYGDFITSKIEIQSQLLKDKLHNTKQKIKVINLM